MTENMVSDEIERIEFARGLIFCHRLYYIIFTTTGMVFSSGLAATTNVVAMLDSGDHIISMDDVYGGTGRLFRQMNKTANIIPDFVDLTDLKAFQNALSPKTKVSYRNLCTKGVFFVFLFLQFLNFLACMD
jgi:O-acetylhomoserine/O-acetylserine sulfhydrylase-like pyridoxal-dependent enzyme